MIKIITKKQSRQYTEVNNTLYFVLIFLGGLK